MKKLTIVIVLQLLSNHLLANDSTAHDTGYQIGYTVGQYLPFILLVGFGWIVYRSVKKRAEQGDSDVP